MRAVLSGFVAALVFVGVAQVSHAANIIRIGVNKIEFEWAAGTGSPEGYLVSRSNKGGPLQAFAWVSQPRVEMPVTAGDQITISVAAGARNNQGVLLLGPASPQSDRIWVVGAPVLPTGGEWLLRCEQCPSMAARSLTDASVVLAEVPALPAKWKVLGRARLDDEGDGMIWVNQATGQIVAWDPYELYVIPGTIGAIATGPVRGVGPADFDGNGIQELVTQRIDTGEVQMLGLVAGRGVTRVASLPAPPGSELVAARDFTRDGLVDFVWRNLASGTLTMQSVLVDPKLNRPVTQVYAQPRTIASGLASDLLVVSSGDYDGDGWLDLLLRKGTGQLEIMYLADGEMDAVADLVFPTDDAIRYVVGSANIDSIPGDEIALQHGTTKEMALVFPAKPDASQRMKWLHPGAQWRAIKWDY